MAASAETQVRPPITPSGGFPKLVHIFLGRAQPPPASSAEPRKRPARLLYDVDEHPPLSVTLVIAIQHVLVMSVGWIYIVVLVSAFGGTTAQSQAIMRT